MSSIKQFLNDNKSLYDEKKEYISQGDEVEIEYRVRGFDKGSFMNLKASLEDISNKKQGWVQLNSEVIKNRIFDDGVRVTYDQKKDDQGYDEIIKAIEKNVIAEKFFGKDKLSISTEEESYTYPVSYDQYKHITRIKDRSSFLVEDYIRIDLTIVKDEEDNKKYEVEVELTKIEDKCTDVFEQVIKNIKKYLPNYEEVIDFFNKTMTGRDMKKDNLIYGTVSRARDLTFKDLVDYKQTSSKGILDDYRVSVKADGEHKFLIFHSSGIWLVFPTNSIQKLGEIQGYEYMLNTIVAGEVITKDNIRDKNMVMESEIFIPFDVLCYKGLVTKDFDNYDERRKYIMSDFNDGDIVRIDNQIKLTIKYKKFFEINSIETFYKSMEEALGERKNTFYKEDGLIITPKKSRYITTGGNPKLSLYQRNLFEYTDICKWKPPESLTIDMKYENGEFYVMKDRVLTDIRDINVLKNMKVKKPQTSGIYEFKPITKGKDIEFKEFRKRTDKPFPNSSDIVSNLYNLSMSPITEDTLKGKDISLMRKHHNIIKKNILNDSMISEKSLLIDVGSGKGGDLTKFGKFSKILMIEPDEDNIQDLAIRSKEYKNISILKSKFEESEKVINSVKMFLPKSIRQKVYLSFMFSMTFFMKPGVMDNIKKSLDLINKEIKDRGGKEVEIIFVTIDGEIIDKILDKKDYSGDSKSIKLNTIQIDKYKDQLGYDITISDSATVKRTQREYPVYLEEFFGNLGYKFDKNKYNTRDKIMSKAEKIYTASVSYGFAEFTGQVNYYFPKERIKVSTTDAYEVDGKIYMKDCDKVEPLFSLGTNVYRISVLDNDYSMIHSILKLTSPKYGDSDSEERNKFAYKIGEKLNFKLNDVKGVSSLFKYQIIEFQNSKKTVYGQGENIIFLYKHTDGTYEPLVRKENGKFISVFKL